MPRTALLFLALLAALALALAAAPRPTAAQGLMQAPDWQPAPTQVAQKKKRRPHSDGRIIACRPGGCFRIPYGCHTETEFDFWGNPTGFDAIVCPGRRRR